MYRMIQRVAVMALATATTGLHAAPPAELLAPPSGAAASAPAPAAARPSPASVPAATQVQTPAPAATKALSAGSSAKAVAVAPTVPQPAQAATAPAPAAAPVAGQPPATSTAAHGYTKLSGTPTIGNWEDLTQQEAFKKRQDELASNGLSNRAGQGPLPPLQVVTSRPQGESQAGTADAPARKRRVVEACPDDRPCFFAVYGVSVDGAGNNYRGLVAVNGTVHPVTKGTQFAGYTVEAISARQLTVVSNRSKRRQHWPYVGGVDMTADHTDIPKASNTAEARPQPISIAPPGMPAPVVGAPM